jgi:hypothetical protein
MPTHSRTLPALLLTAAFALLTIAPPTTALARQQSATTADAPQLITIQFPGGTIEQYLELVRNATPYPVNTIVAPALDKAPLAPINLRLTELNTAMSAMQWAAEDPARRPIASHVDSPRDFSTSRAGQIKSTTYSIQPDRQPQGPIFPTIGPTVRPFAIRDLLVPPPNEPDAKIYPVEEIVDALDGLLRFSASGSPPPEVLVHKSSGMILLKGTADQSKLAETYLNQLRTEQKVWNSDLRARRAIREAVSQRENRVVRMRDHARQSENSATRQISDQQLQLELLIAKGTSTPEARVAIASLTSEIKAAEFQRDSARNTLQEAERLALLGTDHESDPYVAQLRERIEELTRTVQALESRLESQSPKAK